MSKNALRDTEATDLLKFWSMLMPYYENEIHEFIPYEIKLNYKTINKRVIGA